ncbi:MAG: helix-turn-helix transcriptional regulator, partial [Mycobacteriaceae bacterium]|nr:helix-turn-helix transcriptional regulator [Mycobacteriaceae bacterium]
LELAGEAADALDAAISLYAGLAADGDLARIEARARELGIRRRKRRIRALTGWASLTPTERKVAEYVASGWSNSAIAAGMYLSRRTVESHVSRILVKLGLSSRVQVAVLAAERPAEPGDKPFQDDP